MRLRGRDHRWPNINRENTNPDEVGQVVRDKARVLRVARGEREKVLVARRDALELERVAFRAELRARLLHRLLRREEACRQETRP